MLLDPQRVAECRAWLERAWADMDSAQILLNPQRSRPDTALFHCQQAAEKAWKAFLFWNDATFPKTHLLRELGEACSALDESLRPLAERAEDLTQFVWLYRYPGDEEEPTPEEAEEALALAGEVYEAVLARLPAEVRP